MVTRTPLVAAVALLSALFLQSTNAVASCTQSGLAPPPSNTTLAVDRSDAKVAVVVTSACEEASVELGGTQFETSLTVTSLGIVRVVSYPRVDKMYACALYIGLRLVQC